MIKKKSYKKWIIGILLAAQCFNLIPGYALPESGEEVYEENTIEESLSDGEETGVYGPEYDPFGEALLSAEETTEPEETVEVAGNLEPEASIEEMDLQALAVQALSETEELDVFKEAMHFGEAGVNPGSGNFSFTVTDLKMDSPGLSMDFSRTYNSNAKESNPEPLFGKHWSFSFECILQESLDRESIYVTMPNSGTEMFLVSGSEYIHLGSRLKLEHVQEADSDKYILTLADQTRYEYTPKTFELGMMPTYYFLTSIADNKGNTIKINYAYQCHSEQTDPIAGAYGKERYYIDTIEDSLGRIYQLEYYTEDIKFVGEEEYTKINSTIKSITDPFGRKVTFDKDMSYVKDAEGQYTYYSYGDDSDNTGEDGDITVKNHQKETMFKVELKRLDSSTVVDKITDMVGNVMTYEYDKENKVTTVTDSNGRVNKYEYDAFYFTTKTIDAEGKSSTVVYDMTYNGGFNRYGEAKEKTDRYGNLTKYKWDAYGNLIKRTNPDNGVSEYRYNDRNEMVLSMDENGFCTLYAYEDGLLKKEAVRLVEGMPDIDFSTRDSAGLYSRICGYIAQNPSELLVTSYTYYTASETNALFGKPVYGLVKTETKPSGSVTEYTYNQYGWVDTQKVSGEPLDSREKVTRFTYSGMDSTPFLGITITKETPEGHILEERFDSNGRLLSETLRDKDDETKKSVTRIVYDFQDRVLLEADPNAYAESSEVSGSNAYNGTAGKSYTYAPVQDPPTSGSGRLEKETDALGNETRYLSYDLYGNVLLMQKPNGTFYRYEYDVLNRVTHVYYKESENAEEHLLETYQYQELPYGKYKVVKTQYATDKISYTTGMTYDYANRLVEQRDAEGSFVINSYYPNGQLKMRNENGVTSYYKYDGANRNIEQWLPLEKAGGQIGYAYLKTSYTYTTNGLQVTTLQGIDKVMLAEEQLSSYVIGETEALPLPTETQETVEDYYRSGKLYQKTVNGKLMQRLFYDLNDQLIKEENYVSAEEKETTENTYNYLGLPETSSMKIRKGDLAGENFGDNGEVTVTATRAYDPAGNLTEETDGEGNLVKYQYDSLNRLTRTTWRKQKQDEEGKYVFAADGKPEWDGEVTQKVLAYTADGQPVHIIGKNGEETWYAYDALGALNQVTKTVDHQTVDPADKTVTTQETEYISYYINDRMGRVLAEISPKHFDAEKLEATKNAVLAGIDESYTNAQMPRSEYQYDSKGNVIRKVLKYTEKTWNQTGSSWQETPKVLTEAAYQYDLFGNMVKKLDALGYQSGTGETVEEKIQTGYGTQMAYDFAKHVTYTRTPESAKNGLAFTEKMEYNSLGEVIYSENSSGLKQQCVYDRENLTVTLNVWVDNAWQQMKVTALDYAGRPLSETDANGNERTYTYNAFGELREEHTEGDASIPGNTVYVQYDRLSRVRQKTDTRGTASIDDDVLTLVEYDGYGNPYKQTVTNQSGSESISTYTVSDPNGNVTASWDGEGNKTVNTYDRLNRLIKREMKPDETSDGVLEEYSVYDQNGNMTDMVSVLQKDNAVNRAQTHAVYDDLNRLIEKTDQEGVVKERLVYNDNHQQVLSYVASNNTNAQELLKTVFAYDRNNRLISTIDPSGNETSSRYDEQGNVVAQTDGEGRVTTSRYDVLGRLTSVTNGNGETVSYTYDLCGNMLTMTDAMGNVTTQTYNVQNALLSRVDPLTADASAEEREEKTERYSYDASGAMTRKTDRNGVTHVYTYDIFGRMLSEETPENKTTNRYDRNGNVLENDNEEQNITYTYDGLGRVLTRSVTYKDIGKTIEKRFTYDGIEASTGRTYITEQSYEENTPVTGVTTKKYDKAGKLVSVVTGEGETAYSYYDNGARREVSYPNGNRETYAYSPSAQLTNKKNYLETTLVDDYTYLYDKSGNQILKHEFVNGVDMGSTEYSYDNAGRLQSETVKDSEDAVTQKMTYTYDKNGNRILSLETAGGISIQTEYSYNEQNRLMQTVQTTGDQRETVRYSYDPNGNTLSKVKTRDGQSPAEGFGFFFSGFAVGEGPDTDFASFYTYDSFNRQVGYQSAAQSVTYAYNGEGMRIRKTNGEQSEYYLYEAGNLTLELDESGEVTAENTYGTHLISRKTEIMIYYRQNGHGDVTALTDSEGAVQKSYTYDAFGNEKDPDADDTNPFRYCGEYYDRESETLYLRARYYDASIGRFTQEDPIRDGLNWYTYCAGNPIRYADPSGYDYNGTDFDSFEGFYNFTLTNPNEADKILRHLNDTNPEMLYGIIEDYVAYQGGMKEGNDNVYQVLCIAPEGYSRDMTKEGWEEGYKILDAERNMYDNKTFTVFEALNWLIQSGGTGNFAFVARGTTDPDMSVSLQSGMLGMFKDATEWLRGAGYQNVRPQIFLGSTEYDRIDAAAISIDIYKKVMDNWWLEGYEEIVGGMYFSMEGSNDEITMLEISNFIHSDENDMNGGQKRKLIWKPYISDANRNAKKIVGYANKKYGDGNALFDVIMIQSGYYFGQDKSRVDEIMAEIRDYNNNPKSATRLGMQIEFDMGVVTGRSDVTSQVYRQLDPLEKRRRLNETLDLVDELKTLGVPISVYSGGPNEQGYNNIRFNQNTHNAGNHVAYWEGIDTPAYAYGVYYDHFPQKYIGGNAIYDLNDYIYNGNWSPALTESLWLDDRSTK